jgi:acetyl esterase/lipase
MTDVKAAIAWARANVADFGGDPNFVVADGCSAGGRLATLAGLTVNEPQWQPELPTDADTSVDAVVSLYGIYDWQDRSTAQRARFMEFLERVIVKRSQVRHPEVFDAASPVNRVHEGAPPFLVIHGSRDSLIPPDHADMHKSSQIVSSVPTCFAGLDAPIPVKGQAAVSHWR